MSEDNIVKKIETPQESFSNKLEKDANRENRAENQESYENNIENDIDEKSIISEKIGENKIKPGNSLIQSKNNTRVKKVEDILEIDLADVYIKLSPDQKREFKKRGEETSVAINNLLDSARVKVKKILSLIKDWLKMIPGVNKFYLEQLAKSKLDAIMKLKDK